MAQTKVKLISDGVIVQGNLHASHGITTAHIGEGSNLYYTDARVGSYLSSNGYATQSTIVAAITDSAPSTLDTLNELAAALGDDVNFSTTVTNSIGTKMPLAGGTFTGNVSLIASSAVNLRVTDGTQNVYVGSSGNTRFGLGAGASIIQSTGASFGVGTQDGNSLILGTNNTAALTINTSQNATFAGDVQLGGTTPTLNFYKTSHADILANIKVESDTGTGGKLTIQTKRNGNTALDALVIYENQNSTFTGNVGIGLTNPSWQLEVSDTGTVRHAITSTNNGTAGVFFRVFNSGTQVGNGTIATQNNGDMKFFTGTSGEAERMRIGSSGDVLITTNGKFLQGKRNTGSAIIDMIGFSGGTDTLQIKGGTSGAANAISFYDTGGFIGTWYNGNFGIGTTSPSSKLQVAGNINVIASNPYIWIGESGSGGGAGFIGWDDAGNYLFLGHSYGSAFNKNIVINSSGKVGIGTSTPDDFDGESRNLVIRGGVNGSTPTIGMTIATDGNQASSGRCAIRFADGINGNERYRGAVEYNHNGDDMSFRTAGTQKMTLTDDGNLLITSGNVGIGTTSPWTKLAVSGTTASSSPSIGRYSSSTTAWTTILTFTAGTAYSVLLATSENNFSQMWRVSGSVNQQTCYYTLLGDSNHPHSKDAEFRISSSALQYKNINYSTGRVLYVFDVVQSTGTFTY